MSNNEVEKCVQLLDSDGSEKQALPGHHCIQTCCHWCQLRRKVEEMPISAFFSFSSSQILHQILLGVAEELLEVVEIVQ